MPITILLFGNPESPTFFIFDIILQYFDRLVDIHIITSVFLVDPDLYQPSNTDIIDRIEHIFQSIHFQYLHTNKLHMF